MAPQVAHDACLPPLQAKTAAGKTPMSADCDSPWKEALDAYFEAFVALLFSDVYALIAWSRGYESLNKRVLVIAPRSSTRDKAVMFACRDNRD
jgi:hypothetical protein